MKLWLIELVDRKDGERVSMVKAGLDADEAERAGFASLTEAGEATGWWKANEPLEIDSVADVRGDIYDVKLRKVKKGEGVG